MCPYVTVLGCQILIYDLMLLIGFVIAACYFYGKSIKLGISRPVLLFGILVGFFVQLFGGMAIPFAYRMFVLHENPTFNFVVNCPGRYFHSSFLSILVYAILASKLANYQVRKMLDNLIVSVMIMSTIGRIGCFAQGCCSGRYTGMPWAVRFPSNPAFSAHPTQIYMFFSELAIVWFLISVQKKKKYDGQTFFTGLFIYSVYRFFIEFYRTNPAFLYGMTHAQFFSISTFFISGFYLYYKKHGLAKGKQPYVVWPLAVGLIILAAAPFIGALLLLLAAFFAFFFRDPERNVPTSKDNILSPADGRVIGVNFFDNNPVMNGPCYEISIYLSLFDVHVNRSPISGAVGSVVYYPGKSHFAFKKNAATHNKNNVITIFNSRTRTILRQVAGRLTRRVICYCKEGDFVKQGDRIGIIELGSQIQVYIPPGFNIRVKTGDKARSGETILASSG